MRRRKRRMMVSRRRLHLLSSVTPVSQKLRLPPHQHQTYTQRVCIILYSHTFKQFTHHAQSACFGITDLPSPFESVEFAMKPYTSVCARTHTHIFTYSLVHSRGQQWVSIFTFIIPLFSCSSTDVLVKQS